MYVQHMDTKYNLDKQSLLPVTKRNRKMCGDYILKRVTLIVL